MKNLDEILGNTKKAFKLSMLNCENEELHNILLEIITDISVLQSFKEIKKDKSVEQKISVSDSEALEIKKVKNRVIGWFRKKHQFNSKILMAFLNLSKCNQIPVHISLIEKKLGLDSRSFNINFHQMKIIAEKNHGKVFDENEYGDVVLWKPVAGFIESECKRILHI